MFFPGKLTNMPSSNDPTQSQTHRNVILTFLLGPMLKTLYKRMENELFIFHLILKWQVIYIFLSWFFVKSPQDLRNSFSLPRVKNESMCQWRNPIYSPFQHSFKGICILFKKSSKSDRSNILGQTIDVFCSYDKLSWPT